MKRALILPFAVALLLASCNRDNMVAEPAGMAGKDASYVSGVLNVKLAPELAALIGEGVTTKAGSTVTTASGELDAILEEIGATSLTRLFPYDPEFEPRQHREGLDRWYRIEYGRQTPTRAGRGMAETAGVEIAEIPLRRTLHAAAFPFNDPLGPSQWHFFNDGTLTESSVAGADIDLLPVWKYFTGGSSGVTVAVVDGGIDAGNPDLAPVTIPGGTEGSWNFCTGSPTLVPELHGTHVAGIIGAVNNNGKLVGGVAGGLDGNGGVRLLSCQVMTYDPEYSSADDWYDHTIFAETAPAIVWACNRGALVCNNSWGYEYKNASAAAAGRISESDKAAVDYFIKYAGCDNDGNQLPDSPMKGGVVVFAAGNDGWEGGAPGNYDPVVNVGSVGPDLKVSYFSNYGSKVDICAPGGNYKLAGLDEDCILSTSPMDKAYVAPTYTVQTAWMQGTSMSAPEVSGVVALLVSYFGGPGFTCDDLVERLVGGADALASANAGKAVGPLLDAYGAFLFGTGLPNPVTGLSAEAPGMSALLTATVPEGASGVLFVVSKDPAALADIDPASVPDTLFSVSAYGAEGTRVTGKIGLSPSTEYYVAAFPRHRNIYGGVSPAVRFTTGENHAPVAGRIVDVLLDTIGVSASRYVADAFTDPDGDVLTFSAISSEDGIIDVTVASDSVKLTSEAFGPAVIKVIATDPGGLSDTLSFKAICRDAHIAADLYPMPVKSVLNIAPGTLKSVSYTIFDPSGKPVHSGSAECSSFAPAKVDMSSCVPGIYLLKLVVEGEEHSFKVVKI